MPINSQIKKVMVIGSGPIVIGQAAEFDYAGTQACRALKEENLEVILVNSNPATIMTDKTMADHIYIEPLTATSVQKIIEIEKPDSLLSTIGGQTGLTISMELAKSGFLKKHGVQLIGAKLETIEKAENRQLFKKTMQKIGQPCIPSMNAKNETEAAAFLEKFSLPAIIRPDFTLGGTGGGIAKTEQKFFEFVKNGLRASPIGQVLIEKSVFGWKEIEFEVVRDSKGNVVTVCSMENIDPVGIHTGDSFVVAPTLTLSDKEFQMLRSASIAIINELEVEGGCNCQFALNPDSFDYAVIEVNPRVSRSSALASKATGYSIAKVATKIAIGFQLNEIKNNITKSISACFEPALDYVVVKAPRWPFDKFIYAKREIGTQMKSTGEVMSIATNFEHALMKSIQGLELGLTTLNLAEFEKIENTQLLKEIKNATDKRIFAIYEAFKRNFSVNEINKLTKIDCWFLNRIKNIATTETSLKKAKNELGEFLSEELYDKAKHMGFLNSTIERISTKKIKKPKFANFHMVDTCAAEFVAHTPYFYSTFETENEAKIFAEKAPMNKKVLVLGSGPIRIGQGIEFDYCCVHCIRALKELGFEAIICNNNPETVSTDFDTANRLYFEPINFESIMSILKTEKPLGVIVQFGGQTAIKLTKQLSEAGVTILGTSPNSIDLAENRKRFDKILEKCSISRPQGRSAINLNEALAAANELKYPVLLRPSYVLGGQNMIIAHSDNDVVEFMKIVLKQKIKAPILIDKYILGLEVEVDAVCDGKNCLIPGIMEHIERAGVHSGDSISIYPAQNLSPQLQNKIVDYTQKLATNLQIRGLLNIQFVIKNNEVFVIEANPRSSRTIPYISKVTGVQLVNLATKIIFNNSLTSLGFEPGLMKNNNFVAVKVPVFSFEKLHDVDVHLGPEMKSTGEVLGIAKTFEQALFKGLISAGYKIEQVSKSNSKTEKGILITVRDSDKPEIVEIAKKFKSLGFKIYATKNTAKFLKSNFVECTQILKVHEGSNNTLNLIKNKKVCFVISTSTTGRQPALDSVKIRRKSVELAIPCLTSTDTAKAIVNCIESGQTIENSKMIDAAKIKNETAKKVLI